ncbi:MAG: hypothetical protein WAO61_07735 [Solirubrobacterales bacterium]
MLTADSDVMARMQDTKIEALRLLPGAPALFDALADRPGVYLVGGAVRDLMLGFAQFDFDLAVEGSAEQVADDLVSKLGGRAIIHERFQTATFVGADGDLVIDIAETRTEIYERPGALPTVTPASLSEDLRRRDFTVNAIAVALWRAELGWLVEFDGASADLAARILRVTHDKSFIDDPTRLLRLLRYGARLGFTAEPHTEALARAAIDQGAAATVSGARIADELMDVLAERSAIAALDSMCALGLDRALHPHFHADEYLASRVTIGAAEGLSQDLLLLAVCCIEMSEGELVAWLDHLGLEQHRRSTVLDAVLRHGEVLEAVARAGAASQLDSALRRYRPETIQLAASLPRADPETAELARHWLHARRDDHLRISGADLRSAGIPEGPSIGRALAAALALAIDEGVESRDEQLRRALTVARSDAHRA